MTQTPTDALRLVPVKATPQQLETAAFNLSAEIGAAEAMKLGPHIERAYELLVAAAPASPLPGGGWQDISAAPKEEGVKVMAFDGTKVGEAVLYGEWEESNDFEDAVLRWRWANDSCSCCWGKAEPQPTHWMPLPAAPTGEPK